MWPRVIFRGHLYHLYSTHNSIDTIESQTLEQFQYWTTSDARRPVSKVVQAATGIAEVHMHGLQASHGGAD
jgi:hypothetical protein